MGKCIEFKNSSKAATSQSTQNKEIGKCIEFKRPSKATISQNVPGEEESEYAMLEFEIRKSFFEEVEKIAKEAVSDVYEELNFTMDPISEDFIMEEIGYTDDFCISYNANTKDADYLLLIDISLIETDCEDIGIDADAFLVKRNKTGENFYFDHKEHKWQTDEDFEKMATIINNGGMEAYILHDVGGMFNISPYGLNPTEALNMLRANKKIINLAKSVRHISDTYPVFKEKREQLEFKDIRIILAPDDCIRYGSFVYADKAGYHLCQYLSQENMADALEEDELSYVSANSTIPTLFHEIYVTKNINAIKRAIYFMWDHYNDTQIFSFPLSDSARLEGRHPTKDLKVYTDPHGRKLTDEEEKNKNILLGIFQRKRK